MSAATEYAPSVLIPARVRPALAAVSAPMPAVPGHGCGNELPLAPVIMLHRPHNSAPLRLTRRGVLVLSMAVVVIGAALVWIAAASAPSAAAPGQAARGLHAVSVAPGDTLWSIAGRIAPDRDPRAEVAALQRRNHLRGVDLTPGQRLLVP